MRKPMKHLRGSPMAASQAVIFIGLLSVLSAVQQHCPYSMILSTSGVPPQTIRQTRNGQ